MEAAVSNRWLVRLKDAPDERVRIIAVHHAGAAASFFRPWSIALPPRVSLSAVQLPGREDRRSEPFERDMRVVLDRILGELEEITASPYVIFGHSLGGCIAYELALRIESASWPRPAALGISSVRAPASPMGAPTYDLPDVEFLARIQGFGGTPGTVVADPELLRWVLPRLRADTELNERAPLTRGRTLHVPLAYFFGDEDPACDAVEAAKWRTLTTESFESRGFRGGHFYLRDHHRQVVATLVAPWLGTAGDPERLADSAGP